MERIAIESSDTTGYYFDSEVELVTNSSTTIFTSTRGVGVFHDLINTIFEATGLPIKSENIFDVIEVPEYLEDIYEYYDEEEVEDIFGITRQQVNSDPEILYEAWRKAYRNGESVRRFENMDIGIAPSYYVVSARGKETNIGMKLMNLFSLNASYDG